MVREHVLEAPLDHSDPAGEQIELFAREVVSVGREPDTLPALVFLQGGPGFEASRPLRTHTPTWLARALQDYRVVFLDQRGTGRSTPLGPAQARRYPAEALATRLTHHRADSIVRDAELLRKALGVQRWSVLGQSFGGFCAVTYLSRCPESLREVFITGGLPPLDRGIDEVYTATYQRTIEHVERYYQRYPEDRDAVRTMIQQLDGEDVRLPNGDRLTSRRLRQLGIMLGAGDGMERLHHILELPASSPAFLHDVMVASPFSRNPLYAAVHEACYAPGIATSWSAERTQPSVYADDPTMLTGEHVFSWMFDEMAGLVPFREAAQILAEHPWDRLYDGEALAANDVPVAAAVYADDMYVDRAFSEETASSIRGLRLLLTNEYEHDGLNASEGKVLGRLIAMARGEV